MSTMLFSTNMTTIRTFYLCFQVNISSISLCSLRSRSLGKLAFNGLKPNEDDSSSDEHKDTIEFYEKDAMIHPDNLKIEDSSQLGKYE